ncbi:Panacea domain-containing protein [Phocaeicola paurosaccharolyticus]|uniref:Panacea domain-containing protein n=1 Tax=Phocaeicola paurosaccharolyticus TaxID=732242 RepID=UPI002FE1DE9F
MKTADEIDKIKAVVLYLLKKCGGSLDYVALFKYMYFAQRTYLVKYGRTMFDDSFRGFKRGPVPSFMMKTIKEVVNNNLGSQSNEMKDFASSIKVSTIKNGIFIEANESPDMDELASAEVDVLNEILKKTENLPVDFLSSKSHQDKAWINANERAKSDPSDNCMLPLSIAQAGNASKTILKYIRDNQIFTEFCRP